MDEFTAETCLALYRLARLIRRTEEILVEEYTAGQQMRCPMHFCIGQEAAPTALSSFLRTGDHMVSHYRSHGWYLAKGAPLAAMIAEFYGKATGDNGGVAGSMELAHHASRFHSGAIVGGPLGIAMGMAFSVKYQSGREIAVAAIGDGSLDEGVSYEALNFAALHGLPLLTICENNLYAAHTPTEKRTLARSLVERVRPFGMRTAVLDGTDIAKLHARLGPIVRDVRSGAGPCFVEVETYRYCGHVGPENDDWLEYRSPSEIAAWRERDPLVTLRAQARRFGVTKKTLLALEDEIEKEIASAIASAKSDPFPAPAWAAKQVWSNRYSPLVREFTSGRVAAFAGGQNETKLKPY